MIMTVKDVLREIEEELFYLEDIIGLPMFPESNLEITKNKIEKYSIIREALMKQISVQPVPYIDDSGDSVVTNWKCPECMGDEPLYAFQTYCGECGRRIDWSRYENRKSN